jgi:protein-L-isoaspartate(D-aspartate) O-methyltransferase
MFDMQSVAGDAARSTMVESQIRPNQVSDGRLIAAMRELPREAFAPAGVNAYADTDIPLGDGRFMLAPMLIARMAQLVLASHPEKVLVIGAGAGYGAALLAAVGAKVVALEEEARLDTGGLAKFAPTVRRVTGPLSKGWPGFAPYDAVLIEGAVTEIPLVLASQLSPSGRVVAILARTSGPNGLGSIVVAEPSRAGPGRAGPVRSGAEPVRSGAETVGFAVRPVFDCTARVLPAFRPAPVFEF